MKFKSLEDFASQANFYQAGKITPAEIARAYHKSWSGKKSRSKRQHMVKFGTDVWVRSVGKNKFVVPCGDQQISAAFYDSLPKKTSVVPNCVIYIGIPKGKKQPKNPRFKTLPRDTVEMKRTTHIVGWCGGNPIDYINKIIGEHHE